MPTWIAIFAQLMTIFGPSLEAVLTALFQKWFNRVLPKLPNPSTMSADQDPKAVLVDALIRSLPPLALGRRALLRHIKMLVTSAGPLGPEQGPDDAAMDLIELADRE